MLLLPFVPPEALEARGRCRQRPGANLRSGIDPGSPVALGGAKGGAPRGTEEEVRAGGPRPAGPVRGGGARRKRCQQLRVLPSGRSVARAAGGGVGCCLGRGWKVRALPG